MVGSVITELVGWARNLLGNSVTTELESSSLNDESQKFNILVKFVSNKTVVAVIRIQDKKAKFAHRAKNHGPSQLIGV